jgi:long-chain acyl-CoA synthetase
MENSEPATLNELFYGYVDRCNHAGGFAYVAAGGSMVSYSTREFAQACLSLRGVLLRAGLAAGDRVAILSENRPEWHIADFACLLGRLVTVPVYATLSVEQIRWILGHSGARALVFSGKHSAIANILGRDLPDLRLLIALDGERGDGFVSFADIVRSNTGDAPSIRRECLGAAPSDLATIVYTSGTTGQPKGVMLTHDNICFDLHQCVSRLGVRSAKQALSVLPLAHVFERLLTYGYFCMGVPIAYGDPHDLRNLLKRFRPDVIGCVPRILEKIRENVDAEIDRSPLYKRRIARALIRASVERVRDSRPPGRLAGTLVWRKIRRQLPDLYYIITGGAWLDPEIELFFRAAGFCLLQGYGLTETSPVICLNGFGDSRIGTVGKPLEGVEVATSSGGEILTRGRHVMRGYFADDTSTAGVFDCDGWFHTGDVGKIDSHGRVVVTGRMKEILVLSTGKNVSCALVEQALSRSERIAHAFVVGNGRKFTAAVIVPKEAPAGCEALAGSAEFCAALSADIERVSEGLAEYERVKRFCLLPPAALNDTEIFTPTQKLRRNVFEARYADYIDEMYRREDVIAIPDGAATRKALAG